MTEEVKTDGAPQGTPLSEIVDQPRLSEPSVIVDKPPAEPVERKQKQDKPDDEARFRGLLNETLGEREKRQAAERERDQYKNAWAEHQRKLAAEQDKDPAPDMFKDPNGYNAWVDRQISKRAENIAKQQVSPIMQQVSEQQYALSEMRAEKALGPERWQRLNDWIKQQPPEFHNWAGAQPDPYWAAYEQYRQRTTFEKLGQDDLDTYTEKLREQIMAELKGPIDQREPAFEDDDTPPQQATPKSFATGRNADPTRDKGGRFTGPRPLGELIGGQAKPKQKR